MVLFFHHLHCRQRRAPRSTFQIAVLDKSDEIYDIEILVGENPGGEFYAFLFLERLGEHYARDPAGQPILPFFEMVEEEKNERMQGFAPPFSPTREFWSPVPITENPTRSPLSP